MSNKSSVLNKYRSVEFLEYMALRMAQFAKENLQTSLNIDGTPMVARKRRGKPLVHSGAMLASIKTVGGQCIVDAPYAQDVQERTGNTFIGRPPQKVLDSWLKEYQET